MRNYLLDNESKSNTHECKTATDENNLFPVLALFVIESTGRFIDRQTFDPLNLLVFDKFLA